MKLSAGYEKTGFLRRMFRTIWPRTHYAVFIIDGKWVIVFHIVIVALLLWFHFKIVHLHDF